MEEKKSLIGRNHYFTVHGYAILDLNLKGNEIIIYSIIAGFSSSDNGYFTGSRQYLADWCNSTVRGVQKVLNSLVERGYIEKKVEKKGAIKHCYYRTVDIDTILTNKEEKGTKFTRTGEQSSLSEGTKFTRTGEQSSHNSIVDNKEDSIVYSRPQSQLEKVGNNITESNTHTPSSKSSIPTLSECEQYAKEKEYDLDVERFYNYYDALGWLVKGNPVTNWKALLTNWVKNQYPNHDTGNIGNKDKMMALATTGFETPEYDF